MTTNEESILSLVRKLLAKAEAAATEAERDAYDAKASELISKYGVDAAMVAARNPENHVASDRCIEIDDPYARDKLQLLNAIASALHVRCVHRKIPDTSPKRRRWQHQLHLFGMPADLERTEVLYTSLLVQMVQWVAVAKPDDPFIRGDQLSAYRRSWMMGFAHGIRQRLKQSEREAAARKVRDQQAHARHDPGATQEPGFQLVLAHQSEKVDNHLATVYPRLCTGSARQLGGNGVQDGLAAAKQASLGGPSVGSRSSREAIR